MTLPPNLWNVYDRPTRIRTTNFCEGWNNSRNRKIQQNSPNFLTALQFVKQQERDVANKIALARRGNRDPSQQNIWPVCEISKDVYVKGYNCEARRN